MGILGSLPETMKIFFDTFKIEKRMSQTAIINRFSVKLWRQGMACVFSKVRVHACNNGELVQAAHKVIVLWVNIHIPAYVSMYA